jgi:ABC-type nitrate/sulfonate/bicarbonate transport system substrate-binding protein
MTRRHCFSVVLSLLIVWFAARQTFGADKVRIGYSGATISNAMLWVTDEGKLFQKNGIDPELLYLQTTLGQTALIAGEIEMCVYSGSLLSAARVQGADVVMVASFLNKPIYRLVVRRKFAPLLISKANVWASRGSAR